MPALKNPRHEAFAQALARGISVAGAYGQVGFKPHRANAATLARKEHISVRVAELQEEQLAIHSHGSVHIQVAGGIAVYVPKREWKLQKSKQSRMSDQRGRLL
jgi:hypothetical protein